MKKCTTKENLKEQDLIITSLGNTTKQIMHIANYCKLLHISNEDRPRKSENSVFLCTGQTKKTNKIIDRDVN